MSLFATKQTALQRNLDKAESVTPAFLITIDTEGDNAWARERTVTTHNASYLPRFQLLCERYGFKPTYLTNYEMAVAPAFLELGLDCLQRNAAEIGMHLHAWNSPPLLPLTADDYRHCPYLIEYPESSMRAKVDYMTKLLQDTFNGPMVSHRAGRWAFNATYARLLVDNGFKVDCSVTPGVSWRTHAGAPQGQGGTDYRDFPDHAYRLDLTNIAHPGGSSLLELPMTIIPGKLAQRCPMAYRAGVMHRVLNRIAPELRWLRPNGHNLHCMTGVVKDALKQQRPYIEFMLHSSELMPGGSPTFPTGRSIETLFSHMDSLFGLIASHFRGCTLREYEAGLREVQPH